MTTVSRGGRVKNHGGRPPKGGAHRAQLVARVPKEHAEYYFEQAAQLGLPLCDWIAKVLAEGTGLPVPQYVIDEIAAHQRHHDQAALEDATTW